jgi:hypothetical protein
VWVDLAVQLRRHLLAKTRPWPLRLESLGDPDLLALRLNSRRRLDSLLSQHSDSHPSSPSLRSASLPNPRSANRPKPRSASRASLPLRLASPPDLRSANHLSRLLASHHSRLLDNLCKRLLASPRSRRPPLGLDRKVLLLASPRSLRLHLDSPRNHSLLLVSRRPSAQGLGLLASRLLASQANLRHLPVPLASRVRSALSRIRLGAHRPIRPRSRRIMPVPLLSRPTIPAPLVNLLPLARRALLRMLEINHLPLVNPPTTVRAHLGKEAHLPLDSLLPPIKEHSVSQATRRKTQQPRTPLPLAIPHHKTVTPLALLSRTQAPLVDRVTRTNSALREVRPRLLGAPTILSVNRQPPHLAGLRHHNKPLPMVLPRQNRHTLPTVPRRIRPCSRTAAWGPMAWHSGRASRSHIRMENRACRTRLGVAAGSRFGFRTVPQNTHTTQSFRMMSTRPSRRRSGRNSSRRASSRPWSRILRRSASFACGIFRRGYF